MRFFYQIRIRGQLTDDWSDWFRSLQIVPLASGETLLAGLLDQAALHGVLARIRDLNLILLAVDGAEIDTDRTSSEQLDAGQ
jgi:hypothetical protein